MMDDERNSPPVLPSNHTGNEENAPPLKMTSGSGGNVGTVKKTRQRMVRKNGSSPASSQRAKNDKSPTFLIEKMDDIMEDMIDCLFEYEEKMERSGTRIQVSAAERFENDKRNVVQSLKGKTRSDASDDSIAIALLQKELNTARETKARIEEENELLRERTKEVVDSLDEASAPAKITVLKRSNRVLRKDNEELHKLLEEAEKALAETDEMESQMVALKKVRPIAPAIVSSHKPPCVNSRAARSC